MAAPSLAAARATGARTFRCRRRARAHGFAIAVATLALASCARLPTAEEYRSASIDAFGVPAATVRDDRARFRATFCAALGERERGTAAGADCERWLWRLADEPTAPPLAEPPAAPTRPPPDVRFVVVTGAFGDCFDEHAVAFAAPVRALAERGYRVSVLQVSGRSGTEHNARQISAALGADGDGATRTVLIGYSKGALDALEFVVAGLPGAERVAAVVGVSGPLLGSTVAEPARLLYAPFEHGFAERCDPGDGQVLASLVPSVRAEWLARHPLAERVRYFALASLTTDDRLASGLRASWHLLATSDRWNDGQVTARGAVAAGSTLLGFVNADHWSVALDLETTMPHVAGRRDATPFPREPLLEAILLHVGSALAGDDAHDVAPAD